MMRKKLTTTLIIVLLTAGLLLVLSPFIKEAVVAFMSSQYGHGATAGQMAKNGDREALYDFDAIQPPSLWDTLNASMKQDPKAMIGRISVKSVGIDLPILKGTTNANLLVGATTMRPNQKMGEGNYPLAGHHMRRQSLLFGPLLNIKNGAQIVITDLKKDYVYKVTSHHTISEKQSDVINQTEEKVITLITCDRATRTDGRLIVRGKLVRIMPHKG